MNYNNLCYQCFCEKPIREKPCPKCGYEYDPNKVTKNCLLPGTLLNNRYIVGVALGVGGFGITYKCLDTKIGGICAIKEYFPANFAVRQDSAKFVSVAEQNLERYNKIMKRFVEEADLVKSLHHRNVISIYDSFFENNTAYYVMEYCDGIDLRRYTNNFIRKLEYDEGMNLLYQIMNGLEYIHSKGILHRDIAPDNIYVTKNNTVKILDFGSARSEMDQLNRELSVIVKVGYAPIEQYGGNGKQGPYTDIYALGATFYHLFTGNIPIESTQRVADDTLEDFSRLRPDLPDNLKYCIEKSMEITTVQRVSSISEMKSILGLNNETVTSKQTEKPKEPQQLRLQQATSNLKSMSFNREIQQKQMINKASVSIRACAYMIDFVLWFSVYTALILVIYGVCDAMFILASMFPIILSLINIISELLLQTTIGKYAVGLKIIGKNEAEVLPNQIVLRNLIKLLGVLVVIFSRNDELLQDRATDSIVCIRDGIR